MENAEKIVSDAILGESMRFVSIGGEVYTLRPPSIRVILKAIRHLSGVSLKKDNYSVVDIFAEYESNAPRICRALAILLTREDSWWRTRRVAKKLMGGTFKELLDAFTALVQMMGGNDFFALASLARSVAKMAATPK